MEIAGIVSRKRFLKILLSLVYLIFGHSLYSQGTTYNYFYRIYFKDKGDNILSNFSPEYLLSERSIMRRQKAGVNLHDFTDLPVNTGYIDQIASMGLILHCTSKWMNTALFKTQNQIDINTIYNLPFVNDVKLVKIPIGKSSYSDKLAFHMGQNDLPPFDNPILMLNGYPLHYSGYDGTGIVIAVLDGGFYKADLISSLNMLHERHGIKGTYDFVTKNVYVYDYHYHGTYVLSLLAGKVSEQLEGTAPGADFWLIRTEDAATEFPVEEDFWAAGAEFADSVGADIISSSIGYFNFDDPSMNYKYSDMDGNKTFVTRAADIAASKGILVVNSAGNERTSPWMRIIAPSDGDSVIAVGAVDAYKNIAPFSSVGPSADGRIKPDNVAQGMSVPFQISENEINRGNGTSFSCPILSGMCACLMQAVPQALNEDIINALHVYADRFNSPDSLYGYGIPDMVNVLSGLQDIVIKKPKNETIMAPNPFIDNIGVIFKQSPGKLKLEIYTISGFAIVKKDWPQYIGRTLKITELQNMEQGIYIIRLVTENGTFTHKVIKLKK